MFFRTWHGKGNRSRSPVQRDNSVERQYARRHGKVHLKKKNVLRASTTKEEIVVMIEKCDSWHPPHCTNFRKNMSIGKRVSIQTTHKRRIDLPVQEEKGKGKESEKEKVTVAILNIANHRSRTTRNTKLPCMNTCSKAEENLDQVGQSTMLTKGILALKKQLSVREEKHQILTSFFDKSKIQRRISVSERASKQVGKTEDLHMHYRTTNDLQSGMRRTKKFQDKTAYKLHKELFKTYGHCKHVHKTHFCRSYVSTKVMNTATGLAIHSKERVYMG